MGFFMKTIKKAVRRQVKQYFKNAAKSKYATPPKKETLEEREKREKQKIAESIRKEAKQQSEQYLKIIKDSVELVNTTINPEVFFMRYNLILENLEKLIKFECTGIFDNSPELPSKALIRIEDNFDAATKGFLNRSFEKAKEHSESLKTETGKKNAIKRYFDNMGKYTDHMSSEGKEFFEKMKADNIGN